MKKLTFASGFETRYTNPVFKTVEVEGIIETKHTDGTTTKALEKREITLCQLSIEHEFYVSRIGVSIRNPKDDRSDFGETISEGRALKNPIVPLSITSIRKLPKAITNEQLIWAEKHVERNLNDFVNNIRETLRNKL